MNKGAASGLWPVRCAPVGNVAVGSVLWRHQRQLFCTALVKVSFELPDHGLMKRINPVPIRRSDDYLHGVPSLAGASDLAPKMLRAEVTLVGHAYANPRAAKRSVRMTIVRGDAVLVDKTLYVYGNRVKGGAPKPFAKMRIGYERALGGLDFPQNPIGVGMDPDSTRRPNIVDPKHPKKRCAGYAPYPARFLRRRQYRGEVPLKLIEGGIADYPDDFEWKYFQSAPRGQRMAVLKGNEWIMLEGLHPRHERLRARLPRASGLCRVYSRVDVGAPEMVPMMAASLHVEPDDDRCSLVYRGHFPIADERVAAELLLAGAVQCGDEPLVWPASIDDVEFMASPAPQVAPGESPMQGSMWHTAASAQANPHDEVQRPGAVHLVEQAQVEVAVAPPVQVGELRPEAQLEDRAPLMPPSDIPPPPSLWGVQPPDQPWPQPAPLPQASYPAQSQEMSSPAMSSQVAWSGPYSGHEPPQPQENRWTSTDEMTDPGADAADDAGLKTLETTDEMEDADGADDAEHPLAMTEMVVTDRDDS